MNPIGDIPPATMSRLCRWRLESSQRRRSHRMSKSTARADQRHAAMPAWLEATGPRLLYGVKTAVAVALALCVAFSLELDNPSWAGTSACIVCQPVVGASLRKGFFRAVGTVVGATMAVVLSGLFPQDRVGFLFGMALWAALCSFGSTLARNFAAYAFALSGYTLAIIAGDSIADPSQVFGLAVTRTSEILIGIVCGTAVMSLTDLGHSRLDLARAIHRLAREIPSRFIELLSSAGGPLPDGPRLRQDLICRVAALDPVIDAAIGEAPELRHRKAVLGEAMAGLFSALSGWRGAESHLVHLPPAAARREADAVLRRLPAAWRPGEAGADRLSDIEADRQEDLAAVRSLAGTEDGGVSGRLLADAAAAVALGLTAATNGLALLRDPARARDPARSSGFVAADYLPAVVNAVRTFAAVGAGILFWIATEWPSGLGAITFLAVTVLLLAPQQERSGPAALGFGIGAAIAAVLAAVIDFALLPNHESFLALALIIGAFLAPLTALSTVPAFAPYLVAAGMNLVPLVGPTNQITFDTLAFYNSALGIVGGCAAGALALVVIPPVPRAVRADRLVELTLRDLRRMAAGRGTPTRAAWQALVHARLVAMPEGVDPVHGSRLVAALSLGLQVLRLRSLIGPGLVGDAVTAGLARLARRDVDGMLREFDGADAALAASAEKDGHDGRRSLQMRTAIQLMRDVVRQHRHEFGEARG